MGITNFRKLLDPLFPSEIPTKPQEFDSVLYDAQSLLHLAISVSPHHNDERQLLRDIPFITWRKFAKNLKSDILPFTDGKKPVTLVVSFDGEGVPMKWPTQSKRRAGKPNEIKKPTDVKTMSRMVLFGVNKIALAVQDYFHAQLKTFPFKQIAHVYISGCNVPGEGEHKLFYMAKSLGLEHPIVVSIDQDVFVLALLRMREYKSLQIHRYNQFYPITTLYQKWIPTLPLETCSFLFGNDFIPPLVTITSTNALTIIQCLQSAIQHENERGEDATPPQHPVVVLARFIQRMKSHLRYETVTHINELMVRCFWITFFWLKDYYTHQNFRQKYITNHIYDIFDRNQLLTALSEPDMECYEQALQCYQDMVEENPPTCKEAQDRVFQDDTTLQQLKHYWSSSSNTKCIALHIKP